MLANRGLDPLPGTRWSAGGMLATGGLDPVPGTRWGAGGDASKPGVWIRCQAPAGAQGGMLANRGLDRC
jgi:hypothetical protein